MKKMPKFQPFRSIACLALFAALGLGLTACQGEQPAAAAATLPPADVSPVPSDTPAAPTPTPPPLAATVNGDWVLLEDYQAELQRYQDANPQNSLSAADQQKVVLDDMINTLLLGRAAEEAGHTLDDAALQARVDELAGQAGGPQALADWLARNHYREDSFRRLLKWSLLSAWQRDQISAGVPAAAEQVHARQILLQTAETAASLENQLKSGTDFSTLALQYDPQTGGELGWFPAGTLTQPQVEQAAFALQPGQFSAVIQSPLGYHLIYVVERAPDRPLNADTRLALQQKALRSWIEQRRSQSQISILLPSS